METKHKVFTIGGGSQASSLHVWVSDEKVRLDLRHGSVVTKVDIATASPEWWRVAGMMSGLDGSTIHPGYPKIHIGLSLSRGDRVSWEACGRQFQWGIDLPRQTWVDVCKWVAARLEGEGD